MNDIEKNDLLDVMKVVSYECTWLIFIKFIVPLSRYMTFPHLSAKMFQMVQSERKHTMFLLTSLR